MAIRPHVFTKGEFYHIYAHGIGGLEIFRTEKDYQRFLILLFTANGTRSIPRLERTFGLNLVWDIVNNKVDLK